jgi:hypothetical protein
MAKQEQEKIQNEYNEKLKILNSAKSEKEKLILLKQMVTEQ